MNALIDARELVKHFGHNTAVNRVDLTLAAGEILGLVGANGAGKSTLMRLILGLLRPDAGSVTLFGRIPGRAERARLGYVPQGLGLYPDLTVTENLGFVAGAYGAAIPDLAGDLTSAADRPVGMIPLGLRRRVAFAAAMSHNPEVLILDEPTSGVGPLGRVELWDDIAEVARDGVGVLVSTHYMEEAEQCDRVLVLASGRIVVEGSPGDLTRGLSATVVTTDRPDLAFDALFTAGLRPMPAGGRIRVADADPAGVQRILTDRGITAGVETEPASFEEAFVHLTGA